MVVVVEVSKPAACRDGGAATVGAASMQTVDEEERELRRPAR